MMISWPTAFILIQGTLHLAGYEIYDVRCEKPNLMLNTYQKTKNVLVSYFEARNGVLKLKILGRHPCRQTICEGYCGRKTFINKRS